LLAFPARPGGIHSVMAGRAIGSRLRRSSRSTLTMLSVLHNINLPRGTGALMSPSEQKVARCIIPWRRHPGFGHGTNGPPGAGSQRIGGDRHGDQASARCFKLLSPENPLTRWPPGGSIALVQSSVAHSSASPASRQPSNALLTSKEAGPSKSLRRSISSSW